MGSQSDSASQDDVSPQIKLGEHGQNCPVWKDHRDSLLSICWSILEQEFTGYENVSDAYLSAIFLELLTENGRLSKDRILTRITNVGQGATIAFPDGVNPALQLHLKDAETWEQLKREIETKTWKSFCATTRFISFKGFLQRAVSNRFCSDDGTTITLASAEQFKYSQLAYSHQPVSCKRTVGLQTLETAIQCESFERFRMHDEPIPKYLGGREEISGERGYRYLLHMFTRETFQRFQAFDLSFRRWEELVPDGREQLVNTAVQIFEAIETLLHKRFFHDFKRLLLVTPEQLKRPLAHRVIETISQREKRWRSRFPHAMVETRILVVREDVEYAWDLNRSMQEVKDFALFLGGSQDVALIEPGLRHPSTHEDNAMLRQGGRFELSSISADISKRETAFKYWWAKAQSLDEALTVSPDDR